MAKKIRYESFVYRFLAEAETIGRSLTRFERDRWSRFVASLRFRYERGNALVGWEGDVRGGFAFSLRDADLHHRGDGGLGGAGAGAPEAMPASDGIRARNAAYFRSAVMQVATGAGIDLAAKLVAGRCADAARLKAEEMFHDEWASAEDPMAIDVRRANEACTSPEMGYIRARLGELRGRKLLDVGCGLGEASVYFALEGAAVTAMDLSQGMLDATSRLASLNGVAVRTHKAAAEETNLSEDDLFDIVYAGNLLHHVDIAATLRLLKPHLAPDGVFVSWDPLAYNPIINVYRAIATAVRTPDEHPLKWGDIRLFHREFRRVDTKYFWLTALSIFVLMALVQRRNPNRERFWKAVVRESERWEPLYQPLSRLDAILLALFPPLRLLCWNVVIMASDPSR